MGHVTFQGKLTHITGSLPALHSKAPHFNLVGKDLNDRTLDGEFAGKRKLIATVPSLDTGVCMSMTKHLNEFCKQHQNVVVFIVSADLPFAQTRFCQAENVHNVLFLSMMRNKDFGSSYGVLIEDGPLAGILARSIIALDEHNQVLYTELVPEITQEPNYKKAFEAVQG
jgi:thioredoxin-dependent peroxiredoxin